MTGQNGRLAIRVIGQLLLAGINVMPGPIIMNAMRHYKVRTTPAELPARRRTVCLLSGDLMILTGQDGRRRRRSRSPAYSLPRREFLPQYSLHTGSR